MSFISDSAQRQILGEFVFPDCFFLVCDPLPDFAVLALTRNTFISNMLTQ